MNYFHLLIFEDGNILPVKGEKYPLSQKDQEILSKWNTEMEYAITVERTDVVVPFSFANMYDQDKDKEGWLYRDVHDKATLVQNYLPSVIKFAESQNNIKKYNTSLNNKNNNKETKTILGLDNVIQVFTENDPPKKVGVFQEIGIEIPVIERMSAKEKETTTNAEVIHPYNFVFSKLDNLDFVEYTHEFNVLYPKFADNCSTIYEMLYDEYKLSNTVNTNATSVYIILQKYTWQTMVLTQPTVEETEILKNYPEFGYLCLLQLSNVDTNIMNFIQSTFHKCSHNTVEQLNNKLKLLKYYIEIESNVVVDTHVPIKQLLHWWMEMYYTMTTEETPLIKLYDVCKTIKSNIPNTITNHTCIQFLRENGVTIIEEEGIKYCSNLKHKIQML